MTTKHFDSELLSGGIVYGPFRARRRGAVVGVNLLPVDVKICNFDCLYCHCGLSRREDLKRLHLCPSLEEVTGALDESFRSLAEQQVVLDTIIISGNGEPTLYPGFLPAVRVVCNARDAHAPAARIAVLTNGTLLHKRSVAEGMAQVDSRVIKLDAGPPDLYSAIDRPYYPFGFEQLLAGVADLPDFAVQSIFLKGVADNTGSEAVEDWIDKVAQLKPLHVEIYALDRPAPVDGIETVNRTTLMRIKGLLESRTGIEGRVCE